MDETAGRIDPRVARTRAAVLAAGEELLGEMGVHGITVEGVSRKTGVAKTTIYRHWATKADLVVDIVGQQAFAFPVVDSGDPLADLRECLVSLSVSLVDPANRARLLGMLQLAAIDDQAATVHGRFIRDRSRDLWRVLRRCVEAGLVDSERVDTEAVESLVSPILANALLFGEAFDQARVDRLLARELGVSLDQ